MTDKTKTPAAVAAAKYTAETARIRATIPHASREFADAMQAACDEYAAAMVADIGPARAAKKGAI